MVRSLREELVARSGAPLALARTLPAAWYADPEHHRLELDTIFRKQWSAVGFDGDIAEPGSYLAVRVGGVVPVVLVRDEAGALRGFLNVCRHRAAPVAEDCGKGHVLQCPYHAWIYRLDGSLAKAQGVGNPDGFDKADFGLFPVAVDVWARHVFVNLDPAAAPFAPGRLGAGLDPYPLHRIQLGERRQWDLRCNWKVLLENYSENYHTPFVHPQLGAGDYPIATHGPLVYAWDRPYLPANEAEEALRTCSPGEPGWERVAEAVRTDTYSVGSYVTVWPNLMLNVYPDHVCSILMTPTGPTTTHVQRDFLWLPEVTARRRAEDVAAGSLVHEQDIAICEKVQTSHNGGVSPDGVLSTEQENGVAHLHQLLVAALAEP